MHQSDGRLHQPTALFLGEHAFMILSEDGVHTCAAARITPHPGARTLLAFPSDTAHNMKRPRGRRKSRVEPPFFLQKLPGGAGGGGGFAPRFRPLFPSCLTETIPRRESSSIHTGQRAPPPPAASTPTRPPPYASSSRKETKENPPTTSPTPGLSFPLLELTGLITPDNGSVSLSRPPPLPPRGQPHLPSGP